MTESNEAPQMEKRPTLPMALFASAVLVGMSLVLLWLSLHHDPRVHAPLIVTVGVAIMFITASVMMIRRATGRDGHQSLLAAVLLAGFSVAFGGIGLFGDPRYCSGSGPFFLPLPGCKTAFGLIGFFFGLYSVALLRKLWHARRRSHY